MKTFWGQKDLRAYAAGKTITKSMSTIVYHSVYESLRETMNIRTNDTEFIKNVWNVFSSDNIKTLQLQSWRIIKNF